MDGWTDGREEGMGWREEGMGWRDGRDGMGVNLSAKYFNECRYYGISIAVMIVFM